MNPFSDSKNSTCIGGEQGPVSSFPFPNVSPPSYSNSCAVGLKDKKKLVEGLDYHRHCFSDSLSMEGQPSWLDDLLNEPDTTQTHVVDKRIYRRSASDTFAYIGTTSKAFDAWEEFDQKTVFSNTSIWAQNFTDLKDSNEVKLDSRSTSLQNQFKKDSSTLASGSAERHENEEPGSQNSDAKTSASKSDTKRVKQQSAHRSRVRKLQYIAQLERSVQVLQATGSKMSAELEFLDHQNVILNMENRALKQRLDSISQEQLIKQFEHEMLEREVGRLQTLCRIQEQGQMRMHHQQQQQQQNPKHRRTKSRDAISARGSFNGPVQI